MKIIDNIKWKDHLFPHGIIYGILTVISIVLVILTIVFGVAWKRCTSNDPVTEYAVEKGIIGFPPRLPNDGRYVQWTFLHMNDVYELLPLDQGAKGGLARVAYMKKLLLQENNNTITVLAGDLVLPSALSTAKVNGSELRGQQMISTMNTLGLDYMTFGNHEFDLSRPTILTRMDESKFTWISSNVFEVNTTQPFGPSIPYKIITIDGVRILIIAYTIDGTTSYVTFINQASLVNYTKQFLTQFPNGSYDILIAMTHLDISTDIDLASNIPQIDMIMGGHEHENYYYLRGPTYTPIYKADANAATVYIHRCAYNIDTKQFRIYSTLARVTSEVPDDPETAKVANYWYNLGLDAFRALGYEPTQVVSCLPTGVELDGRAASVRYFPTLLTDAICQSMINVSSDSNATIAVFDSGLIRLDDVLRGRITQYDLLRTIPYPKTIIVIIVPGQTIADVLATDTTLKGSGEFLLFTGVQSTDYLTWLDNNRINIVTSGRNYTVVLTEDLLAKTKFQGANIIQRVNITQTNALINYLGVKYPPC